MFCFAKEIDKRRKSIYSWVGYFLDFCSTSGVTFHSSNNKKKNNNYSFGGTPKAWQPLLSCPLLSDYRWNLGGFGRLLSDYRWNLGGFGPCNGQKRQTLKFAHKKHNVSKILERNITSQKFQRENSSVLNYQLS